VGEIPPFDLLVYTILLAKTLDRWSEKAYPFGIFHTSLEPTLRAESERKND